VIWVQHRTLALISLTFLADCTQRSLDLLLMQVVAAGQAAPPSDVRTQAMHTLDYAFQLPAIWQQVRHLLLALAPKMEQAGHRSEWLTLLDLAIEQSRHQRDGESEGELLYQRAILHRAAGALCRGGRVSERRGFAV
jgi:hypothetical protein